MAADPGTWNEFKEKTMLKRAAPGADALSAVMKKVNSNRGQSYSALAPHPADDGSTPFAKVADRWRAQLLTFPGYEWPLAGATVSGRPQHRGPALNCRVWAGWALGPRTPRSTW